MVGLGLLVAAVGQIWLLTDGSAITRTVQPPLAGRGADRYRLKSSVAEKNMSLGSRAAISYWALPRLFLCP